MTTPSYNKAGDDIMKEKENKAPEQPETEQAPEKKPEKKGEKAQGPHA